MSVCATTSWGLWKHTGPGPPAAVSDSRTTCVVSNQPRSDADAAGLRAHRRPLHEVAVMTADGKQGGDFNQQTRNRRHSIQLGLSQWVS